MSDNNRSTKKIGFKTLLHIWANLGLSWRLLIILEFFVSAVITVYSDAQKMYLGEYINESRMAVDMVPVFTVILGITITIKLLCFLKPVIAKMKIAEYVVTMLLAFWLSFICSFSMACLALFPQWGMFLIANPDDRIENSALHESHKQIGVVYKKYTPLEFFKTAHRMHYLDIGISSSQTKVHLLNMKVPIFESMHVGDTVILRVSDKYPRVNKVLNWHPTHDEIEKYKTPVKLVEKK